MFELIDFHLMRRKFFQSAGRSDRIHRAVSIHTALNIAIFAMWNLRLAMQANNRNSIVQRHMNPSCC